MNDKTTKLPKSLEGLPRLGFTRLPATTREQSSRTDILYGVRSLDDVVQEAIRRFDLGRAPTTSRPIRKKK